MRHAALDRLLSWLAEGSVPPLPTTASPLDHVTDAHSALHPGDTVGERVLVP